MHDYIVKHGDSVRSIAEKFCVPWESLRDVNVHLGDAPAEGVRLRVPVLILRTTLRPGENAQSLAESCQLSTKFVRTSPDGTVLLLFIDEH